MSKKSNIIFFFILIIVTGATISPIGTVDHIEVEPQSESALFFSASDLSGVRVALYESYNSGTDLRIAESRGALYQMLTWMNATVNIINQTDILNGALWAHELLVIPEGLGPWIERNIGDEAMQLIREWLEIGGSYIGVRGSAAMAVTDSYFEGSNTTFALGLFNGTSIGMPEMGYELITEVEINKTSTSPDLSTMNDSMSVLFRTGRYFEADPGQEMIVIATYEFNDKPAMIAAPYGEGNLFISSPHFEYEENGDRDGTTYRDSYDDPDSEWPFIMTICQWLIDDSPTVQNTTSWTYPSTITDTTNFTSETGEDTPALALEPLLIAGGIVVVALVIVVFLKKR
ncbi:MAG: BPL-N domain-containing protein [Candidatus Thorarchaeota archaeon]